MSDLNVNPFSAGAAWEPPRAPDFSGAGAHELASDGPVIQAPREPVAEIYATPPRPEDGAVVSSSLAGAIEMADLGLSLTGQVISGTQYVWEQALSTATDPGTIKVIQEHVGDLGRWSTAIQLLTAGHDVVTSSEPAKTALEEGCAAVLGPIGGALTAAALTPESAGLMTIPGYIAGDATFSEIGRESCGFAYDAAEAAYDAVPQSFKDGVSDGFADAYEAGTELLENAWEGAAGLGGDALDYGSDLIDGAFDFFGFGAE